MILDTLDSADTAAAANLIHRALVAWYGKNLNQPARFGHSAKPFEIFPRVYEALDPGQCICARDGIDGQLIGICFTHERETHVAIGIVATDPDCAGQGVARKLLEEALRRAHQAGKPARLVSSLLNLDSYSLYNRLGFIPHTIYQDVQFQIPTDGLPDHPPPLSSNVREAGPEDIPAMVNLEHHHQGIKREKDFRFFLKNQTGAWKTWVVDHPNKQALCGFMVASIHPDLNMIGPGCASDAETSLALIWKALHAHSGGVVVILVPSHAREILSTLYQWGGRNIELHVAQATGEVPDASGFNFPTFLPESA